MNRKELAELAFKESCNIETSVPQGAKNGVPFWNIESRQFMYVPTFHFTEVRGCKKYRYDAVDENGKKHSFEAEDCCVSLAPIWAEIPEGVTRLTVTAINDDGTDYAVVGARVFFRLATFPEVTPPAKSKYMDSAIKAFEFTMKQGFIKHWLTDGTPDPYYDLYSYPSKFISSLVEAMLSYSRLCPEKKDEAMKVATISANWLIGITPRGDTPLADLPLTYYHDYCPDPEKYGVVTANWKAGSSHKDTMMMIYPAYVGDMYMDLSDATGDDTYRKEALKIADYYVNTIEENGSWYLVRSVETGEPTVNNFVSPIQSVIPFLMKVYDYTKNEKYKKTADRAVEYVIKTQLSEYNWEGQFEDILPSNKYYNLTQYGPVNLAIYYAKYYADNEKCLKTAVELMRFVEDQFVVWNRHSPWHPDNETSQEKGASVSKWHSPAALEQYSWYVPIDASIANVIMGFIALYDAGCGELYLAKAKVLADQLTIIQQENGRIPTHLMNTKDADDNFWYNCMFYSCEALEKMSHYENIVFE